MIEIAKEPEEGQRLIRMWSEHWDTVPENPITVDDTFVLRRDGKPVLACGLWTSEDGRYIRCYGMIKSPEAGSVKEEMGLLFDRLSDEAKSRGFDSIVLFAPSDKLANIYSEYGFVRESDAVIPMRRGF